MTGERIALVTTDAEFLGDEERDIEALVSALKTRRFEVETPIWYDQQVDWSGFDLAVMRSPWDYPGRYAEFMHWLDQVTQQVRVLNPPELIKWDMDKRYLQDLANAGVPCAPFEFCTRPAQVGEAIANCKAASVIVKPTVSVASANTGWFASDDPSALTLARQIFALGKTVMVQPAIEHVTRHGENALIYFNGEFAASFHKGPILTFGGGYIGGHYIEDISRGHPTAAEIAVGDQVMAAIQTIGRGRGFSSDAQTPLYARIDVAMAAGTQPQILEVEAFEPAYFADIIPEVAEIFAQAVIDRLAAR
ncbi:hypothetical protein [Propionimicrobium sp. PCR01-08-3]|uniref:ATP-grasp domain-containing protein n=1 Tax=Propionimicrobium sp. PCR01-08-3 TaxID=3052086 RepID=UPI00255C81CB|nr:hypothetical protein [Propionimicrobium sp. PCR01-08-3]WIY82703.1 hypothetical protein QQ658_14580 [Propionimicrobium sp. PCR01-08-3]